MKKHQKVAAALVGALVAVLALTGCTTGTSEYDERKEQQESTTLTDSLEMNNLEEKKQRENDPSAIRYVYLMNYGQIVGYYVIQGKVSSSGSQLGPEQEVIRRCIAGGCESFVLDSAQDDGTYGAGDPGVFFFLADGTMVETDLDYLSSDAPLAIDVPRLGGDA